MKKLISYLSVVVVVLILSSAPLWSMARIKNLLPSANSVLGSKTKVTKNAVVLTPTQKSIIYFNRGNEETRNYKYKQAIKEYTKAIELDPNNASAYINRALAKSRANDFWGSIEDYSIAKKIDPKLEKSVQSDFQAGFYEIKDK